MAVAQLDMSHLGEAIGFATVTVSSTALALPTPGASDGVLTNAQAAVVTVETQPLRYRVDGGQDPTAASGHLLAVSDAVIISGAANVQRARFIRTGTDGTVFVTYYGL